MRVVAEPERTYTQDLDGVWEALIALGDEDQKVAAVLRSKGIKGRKNEACACPIANYLAEIFGEMSTPEVEESTVKFLGWGDDHMQLPDAVQDFVESFDLGWFPELIEEASNA